MPNWVTTCISSSPNVVNELININSEGEAYVDFNKIIPLDVAETAVSRSHRSPTEECASSVWGTKWNASKSKIDLANGTVQFDTPWPCPFPVLIELSKRFPTTQIEIRYADEDIGNNCGFVILLNGVYIHKETPPTRGESFTEECIDDWIFFANVIKGNFHG